MATFILLLSWACLIGFAFAIKALIKPMKSPPLNNKKNATILLISTLVGFFIIGQYLPKSNKENSANTQLKAQEPILPNTQEVAAAQKKLDEEGETPLVNITHPDPMGTIGGAMNYKGDALIIDITFKDKDESYWQLMSRGGIEVFYAAELIQAHAPDYKNPKSIIFNFKIDGQDKNYLTLNFDATTIETINFHATMPEEFINKTKSFKIRKADKEEFERFCRHTSTLYKMPACERNLQFID